MGYELLQTMDISSYFADGEGSLGTITGYTVHTDADLSIITRPQPLAIAGEFCRLQLLPAFIEVRSC